MMCIALQLLQKLVLSGEQIGEALVPYYRQARYARSPRKCNIVPRRGCQRKGGFVQNVCDVQIQAFTS